MSGQAARLGFTLAEVLITLGIIGVVAALTIPIVITNYQKEQTVTQLKKTYSTLKQATEFAKNEYGDVNNWDFTLSGYDFEQKYYRPYLQVVEDRKSEAIYQHTYTDLSGVTRVMQLPMLVLSDGTYVFFWLYPGLQVKYHILVDLNGDRGPNKVGRDIFAFSVYNNALHTYNQYSDDLNNAFRRRNDVKGSGTSGQCNINASGGVLGPGSYCSRLIEMDSWTIAPDYPW